MEEIIFCDVLLFASSYYSLLVYTLVYRIQFAFRKSGSRSVCLQNKHKHSLHKTLIGFQERPYLRSEGSPGRCTEFVICHLIMTVIKGTIFNNIIVF